MDVVRTITGSEPISTADMKLYLKVDFTTDDTLIAQMIKSAREQLEEFCQRSFVAASCVLTLDADTDEEYRLPYPDIATVTAQDGMTVKGGKIKYVTFDVAGEKTVAYTTAGNCPEGMKIIIMKAVAEMYQNRQNTNEFTAMKLPESSFNLALQYTI